MICAIINMCEQFFLSFKIAVVLFTAMTLDEVMCVVSLAIFVHACAVERHSDEGQGVHIDSKTVWSCL